MRCVRVSAQRASHAASSGSWPVTAACTDASEGALAEPDAATAADDDDGGAAPKLLKKDDGAAAAAAAAGGTGAAAAAGAEK